MTPTLIAAALAGTHTALLAWRWRRSVRTWGWPQALGAIVLVIALVTFWLLAMSSVFGMLDFDWNAARLVPTFSLLYGYQLYYPATEGPIHNHLYGPVAALAYLPAAIFRTPNAAVLAGGVLHVAFVLGAMFVFVRRAGVRSTGEEPMALAAALGACLLLARYESTVQNLTMLHADGPTLALGLIACAALIPREGRSPSTRALLSSAVAVILSCWSKQSSAPLPIALSAAVWWMYGRAVAIRYVLFLGAAGVAISATFLLWLGEPMLFNMFEVPRRHPWAQAGVNGLVAAVAKLVSRDVWELLPVLGIGLVLAWLARRASDSRDAPVWLPPLLAAVFVLPTGALGANKLGGMLNSFHSVYYLIAAIAALFVSAARGTPAARTFVWAFCLAGIVAAWHSGLCATWARPPVWNNHTRLAYEFALRHPGEVYFPWQPLSTLLADGRFDHFEYGIFDRALAGYQPTPEHLHAHVPAGMRWIATTHSAQLAFRLFADFSEEVEVPELPGFIVRTRPTKR